MKEFLEGGIALVVIGFVVWIFMDQPFFYRFTGERYVYPMTCKNAENNWSQPTGQSFLAVSCPKGSKPITVARESYIANQNRQQVVELTSDIGFVRRYDNCEVYDADNWFCNLTGPDIGKVINMQDGDMGNSALPFVYVSKIKWYRYKWMVK